MKVETSRFGELEIPETDIISFTEGLIGLSSLNRFWLIDDADQRPFKWLQSLDEPSLAYVVLEPEWLWPGYVEELSPLVMAAMGIEKAEDLTFLVIVTIPEDPREMTANMKGPLIFDIKDRKGIQLILDDERYPLQWPILSNIVAGK